MVCLFLLLVVVFHVCILFQVLVAMAISFIHLLLLHIRGYCSRLGIVLLHFFFSVFGLITEWIVLWIVHMLLLLMLLLMQVLLLQPAVIELEGSTVAS
jgi:hypothetical protein